MCLRTRVIGAVTGLLLLAPPASAQWVFKLEPNHSTVSFSVPIVGGLTTVRGTFKEFDAEIAYDEEHLEKSSVAATIKAYSVDTDIDMRDRDLRGPLFFDVSHHPEITFRSKQIEKRGENSYVAIGALSIRGITREIELPFQITGVQWDEEHTKPVLGVAAKTILNRKDFGVGTDWRHSAIPNFLGDEVTVEIFLWTHRGKKQEAASDE